MNPVEIEMNFPAEHGGNVFGQFDAYMKKIEKTLHVSLILRGDHLKCIHLILSLLLCVYSLCILPSVTKFFNLSGKIHMA